MPCQPNKDRTIGTICGQSISIKPIEHSIRARTIVVGILLENLSNIVVDLDDPSGAKFEN